MATIEHFSGGNETGELGDVGGLLRALFLEDVVKLNLGADESGSRSQVKPEDLHDGGTDLVSGLADRLVGHF